MNQLFLGSQHVIIVKSLETYEPEFGKKGGKTIVLYARCGF